MKKIVLLLFFTKLFCDFDVKFKNLSQNLNAQTAILIVAYNRPHYFWKLIKSLEQNPESKDLPFIFVLDGGPKSTQQKNLQIIEQSSIKNKFIVKHAINYGADLCIVNSLRFIFDHCNFNKVIHFEDDLVVSPNYISLVLKLYEWAKRNYQNIGAVQGWCACPLSKEEKIIRLDKVAETTASWLGYCIDKDVWSTIKPIVFEYEFLLKKKVHNATIENWIRNILKKFNIDKRQKIFPDTKGFDYYKKFILEPNVSIGQDAILVLSFALNGYIKITTVVNHLLHIGEYGFHMTPYLQKTFFGNVSLHNLNCDLIDNFIPTKFIP